MVLGVGDGFIDRGDEGRWVGSNLPDRRLETLRSLLEMLLPDPCGFEV
jgi:hypothetical protein